MKSYIIITLLSFSFSLSSMAQETQKQSPKHDPVNTNPVLGQQFTNQSKAEIEASSIAQIQELKQQTQVVSKKETVKTQQPIVSNQPQSTDEIPVLPAKKATPKVPVSGQPSSIDEVTPVLNVRPATSKVIEGSSSVDK